MSKLYRGPSIDASYQVSVHLAKRFQRKRFLKIGQSEARIACGGHVSIGYGSFCIKFPQSRMKGERHRLNSVLSLLFSSPCQRQSELPNFGSFWQSSFREDF
jgi:hypothetical protein